MYDVRTNLEMTHIDEPFQNDAIIISLILFHKKQKSTQLLSAYFF